MSTLELSKNIDKIGSIKMIRPGTTDGLSVHVRIADVKLSYGNVRYLVSPVSGTGSVWVDSSRVQILSESEQVQQ